MAEAVILEFEGVGIDAYERVNGILGIDMQSGEGDWPAGLLVHSAAAKPGGFLVYELWASKVDQERFMQERLGQALQQGGIDGPPARLEWLEPVAHHDRQGA
jgi:hypothetical protein